MIYTVTALSSILNKILCAKTITEEVAASIKLNTFFEGVISKIGSSEILKETKQTKIDGGVALSSQHALDCLKDPIRTVRFIKGTHQAIKDAIIFFPKERIELLYAGCGPVAPIIITLLSGFSAKKLGITFLDINPSSIAAVKKVIDYLTLQDFVTDICLADAIKYKFPKDKKLHVVFSETMDKALTVEPQVRVTQNLASQLATGGVLIPEKIELFTEHSFLANEVIFDGDFSFFEHYQEYPTVNRQLLFSIDKKINPAPAFSFLSKEFTAPSSFEVHPDICVFAQIIVYKNHFLTKAQSFISNPICVSNFYHTKSPSYQLKYDTKGIPNWKILH